MFAAFIATLIVLLVFIFVVSLELKRPRPNPDELPELLEKLRNESTQVKNQLAFEQAMVLYAENASAYLNALLEINSEKHNLHEQELVDMAQHPNLADVVDVFSRGQVADFEPLAETIRSAPNASLKALSVFSQHIAQLVAFLPEQPGYEKDYRQSIRLVVEMLEHVQKGGCRCRFHNHANQFRPEKAEKQGLIDIISKQDLENSVVEYEYDCVFCEKTYIARLEHHYGKVLTHVQQKLQ